MYTLNCVLINRCQDKRDDAFFEGLYVGNTDK